MAIPPFEMRWGGGKWPTGFKRATRPTVQTALSLAVDGLEYVGMETSVQKSAIVWLAGRNFPDDGGADNDTEFELYIPYVAVKRRKLQPWLSNLALTSVHEGSHTIREETADDTDTMFGKAADEGIANHCEFTVARALLDPDVLNELYPNIRQLDDSGVEQRLHESLLADMYQLARMNQDERCIYERELKEAWFSPAWPGDLSAGEVLGISAVQRLVDDGACLGEIVRIPTAIIFGIDEDIIAA